MKAAVLHVDGYLSFQASSLIHPSHTAFRLVIHRVFLSEAEIGFLAAIPPQSSLLLELFFNPC